MLLEISHPIILIALLISFMSTLMAMPYWIIRAKKAGLCGKDMHKLDKRPVAEIGGIIVSMGFLIGVLSYVALDTFYMKHTFIESFLERDLYIFATLTTILIVTIIGITDDILGWKIGLRQWQKPFLVAFASLPMIVTNAGHSIMTIPFIAKVNLGLLYPLLIIPIGISGAANGFNMLAGYNGLEARMGIITLSALGYLSWITDKGWVAVMAFSMVAALIAFYIFNRFPAKVFPGDTMTYSVGALIAIVAILGNLEKVALILFIPYFIQFFLKLRGTFRKESFAKVNNDGSLTLPYKKYYALE
ncbi:glycosyl transferase family 4, partial [Candidatus Woesearchaeota archaeon]